MAMTRADRGALARRTCSSLRPSSGLVFLTILPMLGVIGISLTEWTGLEPPTYIGLRKLPGDLHGGHLLPHVRRGHAVLRPRRGGQWDSIYAFLVALMLNQKISGAGFWRSVFFLPYIVPTIGAAIVWAWMYESNFGVINYGPAASWASTR